MIDSLILSNMIMLFHFCRLLRLCRRHLKKQYSHVHSKLLDEAISEIHRICYWKPLSTVCCQSAKCCGSNFGQQKIVLLRENFELFCWHFCRLWTADEINVLNCIQIIMTAFICPQRKNKENLRDIVNNILKLCYGWNISKDVVFIPISNNISKRIHVEDWKTNQDCL